MIHDHNADEWRSLEARWKEHYQRVDKIAKKEAPTPQSSSSRWWRYGAAAAVVAMAVATVLLWPNALDPTPSDTLLAANQERTPSATLNTSCDTLRECVVHTPAAAPRPHPLVEESAVVVQSVPTEPTPQESTPELELLGIPADETFQSAIVKDGHQQTYVRCNSLCDAREILNQTQACL